MRTFRWLVLAACSALSACAAGPAPEAPEGMHIFLLAGQSNMAGRGAVSGIDRRPHPRVYALDASGRWVPAMEPLHFDKPKVAGVGPGFAFARELARRNPETNIGLVPAAVGGSGIQAWAPGGYHEQTGAHPWDDAMRRLDIALQRGELKAVLWHQGESDAKPGQASLYESRLHELIQRFRDYANDPSLPVIIGQLGQFREWTAERVLVNAAHANVPRHFPDTRFVPSDGLIHKGDGAHFDAASARELGRRFTEAYLELCEQDE